MKKRISLGKAALKKRLDEGMPRSDIPSYKRAWSRTGKQLRAR